MSQTSTTTERPLRFLWHFVRPDRRTVVLVLVLLVINNGFSLVEPYLFKIVIDDYLTKLSDVLRFPDSSAFIAGLIRLLLIWIGVALISRIAKNFQDYFATMTADRTGIRVYDHAFAHVLGLSMDFHEGKKTGEVMRRITKAREDVTKLVKVLTDKILQNGATILFVIVFTTIKEWRMGVLLMTAVPIFVLTTLMIAKRIKILAQKINREQEQLLGTAVQAMDHVAVVKAFNTEERERQAAAKNNWLANGFLARQTRAWRSLGFVQGTLINFFRTAIVGYGTYLAFQGTVTPGDVIFFTFYAVGIFMPLYELSDTYTTYQDGLASIERLQELLHQHPTVVAPTKGYTGSDRPWAVEFRDVHFAYQPERPILRGVSFTLTPGEKLAIVGGSGGGKSTITKLLLRLYDPTGGSILVDGVDVREWDLGALRRSFGVVFQENILFNESIALNIAYGRPDVSADEIAAAARLAHADEFIARLPQQYQTVVGERGMKLSGGERQRIAVARAVILRPKLYIFDEATSSLDARSEAQVQMAIDDVAKGVSSLTIAHRLSTIVNADQILVLREGRIVERGTHDTLLKIHGEYAGLYATQQRATTTT